MAARSWRLTARGGTTFATCWLAKGIFTTPPSIALWVNGKDLRRLPLTRRKRALNRRVPATTTVLSKVFSIEGRGRDMFAAAAIDLEGIVAK